MPAPSFHQRPADPSEIRRLCMAAHQLFGPMTDHTLRLHGDDVMRFLLGHAAIFGLTDVKTEYDVSEMRSREFPEAIRALLAQIAIPPLGEPSALDERLRWLERTLALSTLEGQILGLFARAGRDRIWSKMLGASSYNARLQAEPVAVLCGAPIADVERCLRPGAPLLRTELIVDERDGDYRLGGFTKRLLLLHSVDADSLAHHMLPPAPTATVAWEDFAHLPARDLAAATVRAAAGVASGVNIMLHGLPGTGKSEFARALADHCGLTAVFAGLADDEGAEPERSERLAHLAVLRALTERSDCHLIIVDEADDVLALEGEGRARRSKLWLNRLVEEVKTPTVWITNDPARLSAPIVRRMHVALAFELPPPSVRTRIVAGAATSRAVALTPDEASRIAQLPAAPAVLANAVAAAELAGGDAATIERAAAGVLDALGTPPLRPAPLPACYDPAFARADQDLAQLADSLAAAPARGWSLLLAGPSGTGKSAWARHLAARLGVEVEEKRGADLLDPYVGGTEARIARAFRNAAERGAMLLIDEADAFLFHRRIASRSWESGMVAELLRWMEHHPAPFVATTNLADTLDPATQRRFTLTVRFRPLTPARAAALFAATFGAEVPAGAPPLEGVTPGDIGVVAKRAGVLAERDPAKLTAWICAEAEARGVGGTRTGFHRPTCEPLLLPRDAA